jgi:hypothetical protein
MKLPERVDRRAFWTWAIPLVIAHAGSSAAAIAGVTGMGAVDTVAVYRQLVGREMGSGRAGFGPVFNIILPNLFYKDGLAGVLVMDAMRWARMFREILLPDVVDLPMEKILDKRRNG